MRKSPRDKEVKYYLNASDEFVIENYNLSSSFANFLPGIAGEYGIPMWVFYVNRCQAIASFGIRDKDHAILEFFPANKAWQLTSQRGFRTFIKIFTGKKAVFYEPFHNGFANLGFNLKSRMFITSYDLKLEEDNLSLGLKIQVEYFTIPNDSYAALVRTVTIKNTTSTNRTIQILDGLPQIVPYGISNLFLKKMGRTLEAWMNVENLDKGVPFYKLDVDPKDRPQVIHIKEGNFYLSFYYDKEKPKIIQPIIDPQDIFGPVTDFAYPYQFLKSKKISYSTKQVTKNKTPSAFSFIDLKLAPKQEKVFYSLAGYMRNQDILNSSVAKILTWGYLLQKKEENRKIIQDLQQDIATLSSHRQFDLYAQQTYLDNILRGGYPLIFTSKARPSVNTVFYVYSRKHGDLERDYNEFQLQPTYFSQGNGNYRDINQNRRCDVWFNPNIKDENIITFFNLIQSDGFNPLVFKGVKYTLKNLDDFKIILRDLVIEKDLLKLISLLNEPFTPGEVVLFIKENRIRLKASVEEFLGVLLSHCLKLQKAQHDIGFWTDHWTYNLDLLESYLGVYPEKLKEIVFDKKVFSFYDNSHTVRPRKEKYILLDGKIRQLYAVCVDNAKREIIKKRMFFANLSRTQYGQGQIYQATLINKLLCLLVNKLASLDPFGVGIEMEADKPNWFDALNGLPALFGSSLCETWELKRLILFIKDTLHKTQVEKVYISEEIYNFLTDLNKLIKEYLVNNSSDKDYQYWDKAYTLKEEYRQKTRFGFSGREIEMLNSQLLSILNNALNKIDLGINKAYDKKSNLYHAYFINEVAEYEPLEAPFVKPTKFIQKKLPLFLAAQVHALKIEGNDINRATTIYNAVKRSPLYDKKLKMYKVTASLKKEPLEIGRCRIFTPGWLEHESIWLHMEYKYMLELLRKGLYQEFYQDFKNVFIPFQKPQRYGRSILENSSFLVSSSFPDKNLHGNGFVARLSGSTIEFLHMWLIMNLGSHPFILNSSNELNLQFKPILAGWLFTQKDKTYSFNFLGKIKVVYHNPQRKDTFGRNGVKPKRIVFNDKDGNLLEIPQDTIPSPYAQQIRARQVKQINIYLG